jgi:predicted short-subunit dehydrogenase-like oxidoreductase (DUF2520 family)
MEMQGSALKIVMIGAGNLANNLSLSLLNSGYTILQIFSRTENSAKTLASKLNTDFTNLYSKIRNNADIYFFCVKDDVIEEISKNACFKDKFLVHTSGSTDISVFSDSTSNAGVFYPLQTFSAGKLTSFENIPLCIEATNDESRTILLSIANKISKNVHLIDSEQRKYLHLAAVFACNFSNYMYFSAETLLIQKNIPLEILYPLIIETANKILYQDPKLAQTGPAIRKDIKVLTAHLDLLSSNPELKKLYSFVSDLIGKMKNDD